MFHQALSTSVYMTIIFVLFLLWTLFLVWCNHSIDAVQLPPPRSYNRQVSSVKWVIFLPNFLIFWRMICFSGGGAISNLLRNGRGWRKWSLRTIAKGEGWSKKQQIERYVTVNLCSLMFLLQNFTITYLSDGVQNRE